jgi:hypothetical protein
VFPSTGYEATYIVLSVATIPFAPGILANSLGVCSLTFSGEETSSL